MNYFFKVPEMSQNRLIWAGIDLTSVPAKFGGPRTSITDTMAWLHFCPNLAPNYPEFLSQPWDSDLGPLERVTATFVG